MKIEREKKGKRKMGLIFRIRGMVFMCFIFLMSTGKMRSTVLRISHSSYVKAWKIITR